MSKLQPNLDILYDKVLEFNVNQPDEYFEFVVAYLSENPSQIHDIFDNLVAAFANQQSLLNALQFVFLAVWRLGAPAFFGLESSKILELQLDINMQHDELLELKRIAKYCTDKFQKMQTLHEIPNINQKYNELCLITNEELPLPEVQLTEFEKQYSELAGRYKQFEQLLEQITIETQSSKDSKAAFENSKGIQLLEQIDKLIIQPDQRFTKSENELILNFFHQKYALINKIYLELPLIAHEYQRIRLEKKALRQEKNEEEPKPELPAQNLKDFTSFIEGASLAAFPESMTVEYKDYLFPFKNEELRRKLRSTLCAFLNTNGGRILIGIGNNGFRVKGLFLTTNDQDTLIRDIDTLLKDFHPKVEPEEVNTTFIPVKKKDNTYKPGFYVVKIAVKRGKPNELYFTGRDCYKRRNGQNDVQMPANFKRDIIERAAITMQTHPDLFKDRGEYNDPAPELGAPVTNVKEKQPNEIKPIKAAGPKQKQNQPAPAGSTKLSIKNIPAIPDVEMGLKALLSTIGPATKTVNFTKDNECVLTFTKSEEAKSFLEYAETNPIVLGPNILQFNMKPFEKEKPEKKQIKVEIEEEKKEPVVKIKTDNTSIIWVRGITENTGDLKDKLTQMLGPFSTSLKDIKIHNKKKRATLEFESSAQANQVLAYLTIEDRFLGETKVSFEKASPPSSPNHGSKPIELGKPNAKNESAKAKQSKAEGPKEVPKVTEITESNAIKISNISMEPNAQIGYLINACGHLIKKAVERQVFQDHALFFFKDKEEAKKAYTFLIENNFTFQGRKLKVEYFIPIVQNVEPQMPTMNYPNQGLVRSEAVHTERLYPTFDMPDLLASLPVLPHGQVNQYQQFNAQNMYQAPPNNLLDSGPIQHDPNALDFLIQQHQLLQQNLFENPPEHQNQPAHENQQSLESQKIQSATIPANPLKDQIDLDFETLQLDIQKLNRSLSSPRAETQSDDVTDPQNAIDSQQNARAGSLNDGLAFSFNPTANKEAGEQRERFMTPAFPQGQGPLVSQQDNATQQPQMNPFMHMVAGKQQSSPSVLEQSGAFNAQNAQSQGLLPSEQSKEGVPTQTHDQNQNVNQNMPPSAHTFNTAPANLSVQSIQNMSQGFRPMSEGAQSMSQFGQIPQDINQPGLPANAQGSKTVFGRPSAENALPPINQPQGLQNPNQAMPSQPQEIKSVFGRPPQQNMTSLNPPSMTTQEQQKSQGTQPVDNLNQNTQQQQGPYPQYSQFPQSTQQTGFPQMGSQGNQQINPNQFVPNPMGGAPQQQNIQRPGPQPPGNQPPANMPVSPQQNANQQFVLNPNYFTQSLQKPTVQPSGPQGIPSQPTIQPPTNMGQQQQIPQQNLQQPNVPGNQNAGQQGPGTGTGPQNQNMPPYPQSGNPNMPPGFPQGLNTGNQQGIQQNSNLPQHLQTQQTPQNSYPPGVNVNNNFGMSTPSNMNPNVNPNMNPNQWQQNQNQNANMGNNMGSMQQDPKSHMPQQSYPGYQYPNQQFNQGQFGNPQYQQNANPQGQGQGQGQYFNQQGQQYPTQQGQFPMQQQPYPMQPGQYPPQFQGQQGQYPYPQGYPNQMGTPQGSQFQPTNTKATGKPDPKDSKKQSGKNQSQTKNQTQQGKNQQQLQPQIQGQMPIPGQLQSSQQVPPGMMGNYQNYGMNANYQGYPGPNNQMPGTGPSGYGQSQMGYGANPNMQNQQQNPMYQNMQGNIPGNMQGSMQQGVPNYQNAQNFNTQGLTPQQIQQMQMQQQMQQQMPQMQYYGGQQQYPPNMGMNPNVRSK